MPVDRPFVEENVLFLSGGRTLEGVLAYPEQVAPERGILLLSPHPHMGGRMNNNVIEHLARRFAEEGCVSLRFNYGGVGNSTLDLPEGESRFDFWARLETEKNYRAVLPDVVAAREYLLGNLLGNAPLGYVGYSFGSCQALLLAELHPPAHLAAISPPVNRAPLEGLASLRAPVCFVAGDRDFVFDRPVFEPQFALVPGEKSFVELGGCDHFFRKQEERVYRAVRSLFLGAGVEECHS